MQFLFIQQKKYRQQPYAFKHTSVTDSPDIVHAKFSNKITNEVHNIVFFSSDVLTVSFFFRRFSWNKIVNLYAQIQQRLYKEKGENLRHNYTITAERPEITQARINAANFSDVSPLSHLHDMSFVPYF